MSYILWGIALSFVFGGIRIINQTERGALETLGKYSRFVTPGFNWIIPIIQSIRRIDVTERMSDIEPQEIITEDNLNAMVDLVVFYRVRDDEGSVKKAFYEVGDVESQIQMLARTTARNTIGGMQFKEVNSKRAELNKTLAETLTTETEKWGVDIVRVELKEITPPKAVQETMNQVIVAENAKRSAIDFATAEETKADGARRAAIKEAEGKKQASILEAEGQATAFDLINKSFVENAQILRRLEVTENSLKNNSKIILTQDGISPNLIIGEIPTTKPAEYIFSTTDMERVVKKK